LLLCLTPGALGIIAALAFHLIAFLRAPMPRTTFLLLGVSTGITSFL
jgi:hypothetical protein